MTRSPRAHQAKIDRSHAPTFLSALLALFLSVQLCCTTSAQEDVPLLPQTWPDLVMMQDPPLPQPPPKIHLDPRSIELWLAALQRPELDVRLGAVDAFTTAHKQGAPGLEPGVVAMLPLLDHDPHPHMRFAVARALNEFDWREAAGSLLDAVADCSAVPAGMVTCIDEALARWNWAPAQAEWISRVRDSAAHPTASISAIRCLSRVRATQAATEIMRCASDRSVPIVVRIEAARAAALIQAPGRDSLAITLAREPEPWGPLMALLVLGASDESTTPIVLEKASALLATALAGHSDPRVRASATALLRRADPAWVVSREAAAQDPDDQVRLEVIRAHTIVPATQHTLATLASALNDDSEPIRVTARSELRGCATESSHLPQISKSIAAALTGGKWREAEQAAILAGELSLASAATQLVDLLVFDRPEVRLAAATALRKLSVPDTLPSMLRRASDLSASAPAAAKDPPSFESIGQETTQLFIAIAQSRYLPATELLRSYIPKRSGFHPVARGAAVYALGKIYDTPPDAKLVEQLQARLADNNPLDPEAAEVRRFAAIGLARMNARDALPTLREFYEAENSTVSVGGACRWAIMHLERIELPPCRPIVITAGPFFLQNIDSTSATESP